MLHSYTPFHVYTHSCSKLTIHDTMQRFHTFFLKWKWIHIANLYVIRSLSYDTKDNMRYIHRLLTISHSF